MYIEIYKHACIHTYVRTYVRTYVCTYIHTYVRTYIHTYVRTYVRTYTCTRTYIPIRTYTYNICKYAHVYTSHRHLYTNQPANQVAHRPKGSHIGRTSWWLVASCSGGLPGSVQRPLRVQPPRGTWHFQKPLVEEFTVDPRNFGIQPGL